MSHSMVAREQAVFAVSCMSVSYPVYAKQPDERSET